MISKIHYYYKIISSILLFIGVIFITISSKLPISKFIYNPLCLCTVASAIYIISKRIKLSFLTAALLLSSIITISLKKKAILGNYLVISDIKNFLSNPILIIDCTSWIIYPIILVIIIILVVQFKIEAKTKINNRIIIGAIVTTVWFLYLTTAPNYSKSWEISPDKSTLLKFFSSISNQSESKLKIPDENIIEGECCIKASGTDFDHITDNHDSNFMKPNIVVILMESTMDISTIKGLKIDSNWKDFHISKIRSPVKGGGTWVSEYALLHGVPPHLYGENFPNINFLGLELEGRLPTILLKAGYETNSLMTYRKNWFNGDNYHKSLGIQKIIDCKLMRSCNLHYRQRDELMLKNIVLQLDNALNPQFLFGITMDQHGPHHFIGDKKEIICSENLSDIACDNINEYNKREKYLQKELLDFFEQLNQINRPTYVFLFGDHIPAAFSENIPESNFENSNPFITVSFGYSNVSKNTFSINSILPQCHEDYIFQISDLDALILTYSKLHSKYLNDKLHNITNKCIKNNK